MEAETLNYKPDWPQGSVMVDEGIERMLYKPLLYKPDWPEAGQRGVAAGATIHTTGG